MKDLDFIAGTFFTFDIPKEKQYLLKYFRNELQVMFLKYFMVLGDAKNFTDHTGYYCTKRFAYLLKKRYYCVSKLYDKAKRDLTEESMKIIHLIESGKLPLTKIFKS